MHVGRVGASVVVETLGFGMFNVSWISVGWVSGGNLLVLGWLLVWWLGFGQNIGFLPLGCRSTYRLLIRIGQDWVCLQNLHSLRLFFWLNQVITIIICYVLALHSMNYLLGLYRLTKYKTFWHTLWLCDSFEVHFYIWVELFNFYCSTNISSFFVSERFWI